MDSVIPFITLLPPPLPLPLTGPYLRGLLHLFCGECGVDSERFNNLCRSKVSLDQALRNVPRMYSPARNPIIFVHHRHCHLAYFTLSELLAMQMVLSGHPAHIHMGRILSGEYPDSVEILVD
jgi:hypothetical protein